MFSDCFTGEDFVFIIRLRVFKGSVHAIHIWCISENVQPMSAVFYINWHMYSVSRLIFRNFMVDADTLFKSL